MRNVCLFVCLASLSAVSARAQAVSGPRLALGDSWTYQSSHEVHGAQHTSHQTTTLVRIDPRYLVVETHAAGLDAPGPNQLVGTDWSRMRSVNGRETVVNRPLAYPLSPGKSWTLEYTELNPNRAHTQEHVTTVYRVVGWEDVTVPAGTFRALRIDGDGTWTAVLPPSTLIARGRAPNGTSVAVQNTQGARVASGRTMKVFWYVPKVGRWVKSSEEYYSSNGTLNESYGQDLEAYSVAAPAQAAEAPTIEAPSKPHRTKRHQGAAHHSVPSTPTPTPLPDDMEQTALPIGTHAA